MYLANGEKLTLHDIFTSLKFGNRQALISFSACEVGITGSVDLIDEFVGLGSAFLSVGATHIVSSLWKVETLATSLLMTRFYENLYQTINSAQASNHPIKLANGDVAIAMRQAQMWLKEMDTKQLRQHIKQHMHNVEDFLGEELSEPRQRRKFRRILKRHIKSALRRRPYPFEHPYYWAGFITVGL